MGRLEFGIMGNKPGVPPPHISISPQESMKKKTIKAWAITANPPYLILYDCVEGGQPDKYWIFTTKRAAQKAKQSGTIQKIIPVLITLKDTK